MLGDSTPKIGQDVGPAPTDLWNVGGGGGAGATTGGSGGAGGGTADWLIPLIAMFAGSALGKTSLGKPSQTAVPVDPAIQPLRDLILQLAMGQLQGGAGKPRNPYPGLPNPVEQLSALLPGSGPMDGRGPLGPAPAGGANALDIFTEAGTGGAATSKLNNRRPNFSEGSRVKGTATKDQTRKAMRRDATAGIADQDLSVQGDSTSPFDLPMWQGPYAMPLLPVQLQALNALPGLLKSNPLVSDEMIRGSLGTALGGLDKRPASQADQLFADLFGTRMLAKGGRLGPGWNIVGEEGPETIDPAGNVEPISTSQVGTIGDDNWFKTWLSQFSPEELAQSKRTTKQPFGAGQETSGGLARFAGLDTMPFRPSPTESFSGTQWWQGESPRRRGTNPPLSDPGVLVDLPKEEPSAGAGGAAPSGLGVDFGEGWWATPEDKPAYDAWMAGRTAGGAGGGGGAAAGGGGLPVGNGGGAGDVGGLDTRTGELTDPIIKAFLAALNPQAFDTTELFKSGEQVYASDLDQLMAQVREESARAGLQPGSTDRTQRMLREGGDLASRFRLGQQEIGRQGFESSANRGLQALGLSPSVASVTEIPFQRQLQTLPFLMQAEQGAANRGIQALAMLPEFRNIPYNELLQAFGLGEAGRGIGDTEITRRMNEFARTQGGQLDQLIAILTGSPQRQTTIGPSPVSQGADLAGSILQFLMMRRALGGKNG